MKFKTDFQSKMSACEHELGGSTPPPAISTLKKATARHGVSCMQFRG